MSAGGESVRNGQETPKPNSQQKAFFLSMWGFLGYLSEYKYE